MGQLEQAAQPLALGFAKLLHLHEPLRAAEHGAEGNDQNVGERMTFGTREAGVFKLAEVIHQTVGFGHPEFLPTPDSKVHP